MPATFIGGFSPTLTVTSLTVAFAHTENILSSTGVSGCAASSTVTWQVAVCWPALAVTMALPAPTACKVPSSATVATLSSLLENTIPSAPEAESTVLPPTVMSTLDWLNVSTAGAGSGFSLSPLKNAVSWLPNMV